MTSEPDDVDAGVPTPPGSVEGDASSQPRAAAEKPTGETKVSEVAREVSVRRAPRLSRFLILGAGLGAVVAFILTAAFEVDPEVGFGASFGYFALYGIPIGLVVGGTVALVLDRRATRRAKPAIAGKLTVRAGDGEEHEARNT